MNFELGAHAQSFPTTWTIYFSHVWEVTTFLGDLESQCNCHANVRMATVLISLFRWLSSEINERYWAQFIVHTASPQSIPSYWSWGITVSPQSIPSYLSLGTTASPQSHQKVYKTAEARLLSTLSKVHTLSWCNNTRGCYHECPECQEIKCLCEQQKPGLLSDWLGNEATISNDLSLQSGYTI